MAEFLLKTHVQPLLLPEDLYEGEVDENGLRKGAGFENWRHPEWIQKYNGAFFGDCLHGRGAYEWIPFPEKTVFEGTMYSNHMDGYGVLSYHTGDTFEGLFKSSTRFGPGVLTYANQAQDVGLWQGIQLVRVCHFLQDKFVPRLGTTALHKLLLLRHRHLVHIDYGYKDPAKKILTELHASDELIENSDVLYSQQIHDVASQFFNHELYDKQSTRNKTSFTIDVALTEEEIVILAAQMRTKYDQDLIEWMDEKQEWIQEQKLKNLTSCQLSFEDYTLLVNSSEEIIAPSRHVSFTKAPCDLGSFEEELEEEEQMEEAQKTQYTTNKPYLGLPEEKFRPAPQITEIPSTRQVVVQDIIAWNNNARAIDMLRQVFLHRDSESEMSFDVTKILESDRAPFRRLGPNETAALTTLNASSVADGAGLDQVLSETEAYAGVCDARGNTGLIMAVVQDNMEIIDILWDFGADPDHMNDEGFSALTMSITRYLAVLYKIECWRDAFLPPLEPFQSEEIIEWRKNLSFTDLPHLHIAEPSELEELSSEEDEYNYTGGIENQVVDGEEVDDENLVYHMRESIAFQVLGYSLEHDNPELYQKIHQSIGPRRSEVAIERPVLLSRDKIVEKTMEAFKFHLEQKPAIDPCAGQTTFLFDLDRPAMKKPKVGKTKTAKSDKSKKGKKKEKKQKKEKSKKEKNKKDKTQQDGTKKGKLVQHKIEEVSRFDQPETKALTPQEQELDTIFKTVIKLLDRGANPNVATVPLPPLLLSIFTQNLDMLKAIFEAKADPDVTNLADEGSMTGLHMLCSKHPSEMVLTQFAIFLNYGANPNIRAFPPNEHTDRKKILSYLPLKHREDMKLGQTPLHMLALRQDEHADAIWHNLSLIYMLLHKEADTSLLYLQHTPLTLAIIMGQPHTVQALMGSGMVDPNFHMGGQLGLPLMVLMHANYQKHLPYDVSKDILDILTSYCANPLEMPKLLEPYEGNVVDFAVGELGRLTKGGKSDIGSKSDKGSSRKSAKSDGSKSARSNKSSKSTDRSTAAMSGGTKGRGKPADEYEILLNTLEGITRSVQIQHIQGIMTQRLHKSAKDWQTMEKIQRDKRKEDNLQNELIISASWLTPAILENSMELLILNDLLQPCNKGEMTRMMEHIITNNSGEQYAHSEEAIHMKKEMMNKMAKFMNRKNKNKLHKFAEFAIEYLSPIVDEKDYRYDVCFECCQRLDKKLRRCNICRVVQFCSVACIKRNRKRKTHPCESILDKLHGKLGARGLYGRSGRGGDDDWLGDHGSSTDSGEGGTHGKGSTRSGKGDKTGSSRSGSSRGGKSGKSKKGRKGGDSDNDSSRGRSRKGKKGGKSGRGKSKTGKSGGGSKARKGGRKDDKSKFGKRGKDGNKRALSMDSNSQTSFGSGQMADYSRECQQFRKKDPAVNLCDVLTMLSIIARCSNIDSMAIPYCVLRDGNLYYRMRGPKPIFKENYSLL